MLDVPLASNDKSSKLHVFTFSSLAPLTLAQPAPQVEGVAVGTNFSFTGYRSAKTQERGGRSLDDGLSYYYNLQHHTVTHVSKQTILVQ